MCSQVVLAAHKGTLLYVPLDDRPVCLSYAVKTMEAAGWEVKTPPLEYIAGAERGGNPDALFAWLMDNADESLAMVVSSDALIYGGLVDSRTHFIPLDVLRARADRLVELKKDFRNQLVYVFTTIMRSPKMSSAPVEPAYYKEWGSKIFRLGELEDKLEAREIGHREKRELRKLRNSIPQEILADMYARRGNNIKATELLLHGVESGDFDYLLVGRDDTAEFSQAHREARNLEILVNELPKERIRFFAGADQLGLLLLNRASNKLRYEVPLVQIVYIRLITEVECRRERGLHGNNKAADGLYTAVEKLAKRVNISPEEYYEKRIYPIIVNIRTRRIKQFYRFYSGKTLKKLNYF